MFGNAAACGLVASVSYRGPVSVLSELMLSSDSFGSDRIIFSAPATTIGRITIPITAEMKMIVHV